MENELILRIVILLAGLGIVHWGLVPLALGNLFSRENVSGGHKALWGMAIVFLTCIGSLAYMLAYPEKGTETAPQGETYWDRFPDNWD